MQLRRRPLLLLAAGALGTGDARADGAGLEARVSSETAAYADSDHVAVITPSVAGHVGDTARGWSVDARYLVDVVSAASVDIVSTASRRWTETRQAGSARVAYKPRGLGLAVDSSISDEPDYVAYAVGGTVSEDLDDRNWTIEAGYGYGHDTIGRAGTPFSVYSHAFDYHRADIGVTRLLDRRTVLSIAGDATFEDGDSSKPYRYVPLFSVQVAPSVPAGATIQWVNAHRLPDSVIERLPLSRQRYALTARLAHRFAHSTVRLESELYDDSWDLKSFAADGRDLVDLGARVTVGPHVRYYVQSPVSFWKIGYVGTDASVPAYRSGDRELGPLMNLTLGARTQWAFGGAADPSAWVLVATFDGTYTRFLDDLYIARRVSGLTALTLEASW